ncbi:MAG TPA: tRNA (adenosine(37)-N6)-threonylcarbamoyltransferase complex ATPase subunit type 1 TsaE [Panacibacter sp.]|nr:tRNA (adenosine(37)-N6)-threonylcarbamoyltransferase complex ATPase subunit type 1 TsaE [Panacibacter sp.]HNP42927.1 tRNA (adenosine(37)-N6)-threonylcarbamoyltransferase complex ATPase subunit type 1 TsaE [Panacibacter sp.]
MEIIYQQPELARVAGKLWNTFGHIKIWAFFGEMGVGKTTLIHQLCVYLQVKDTISSPTFSIINEYKSNMAGTIYHMDWYRLAGEEEAEKAGVEDCLLSGNFCFVEWPGNAPGLLTENILHIQLGLVNEHTRKLKAFLL